MEALGPTERRLVSLFAEALLLAQEGRAEVRDRLRLVERAFDLSLVAMRRLAQRGELGVEHLGALDRDFGIAPVWILDGDTDALSQRIVAFCRDDLKD